jgi:hypothetical protein
MLMSRAIAAEPPVPILTTSAGGAKAVPIRRELLTRDPEIAARAALDERTVERYVALMREGTEFPPLVVFDNGDKLFIADGFLRDAAAERASIEELPCEVRRGTRRDAQLFAIQANGRHGKPLTRTDRQLAVERLLADPEWSRWSDRVIGKLAGVSHSVVNKARRRRPELKGRPRVVIRGGQVYEWTRPKEPRAPNYYSDYLYYLVRLTPEQFARWQQIVALRTDRKILAEALEAVLSEPAEGQVAPAKPKVPPDYITNWLAYLPKMAPMQLLRWRNIIKSRVSLTVLAEAVDLVMRETRVAGQPSVGSQR